MTPDRQFHTVTMSPFLSELRAGLYERLEQEPYSPTALFSKEPALANETALPAKKKKKKLSVDELRIGVRVRHPFFGEGVVSKDMQGRSVDVAFPGHGIKTLHLDYAKLSLI